MNDLSVQEGNKLIAEFMGFEIKPYEMDEKPFTKYDEFVWDKTGAIFQPKYLTYHSSWDWLMPVVEKINHMPHRIGFFMNNQFCGVHGLAHGGMSIAQTLVKVETKNNPLIQSVWQAVIQFIQWYNKEHK